EFGGERIEQLRVGGWIADTHVIDRFDESAPHEMRPDHVGEVSREVRIFGRSQPAGEGFAAGLAFYFRHVAAEKFRTHGGAGYQVFHLAVGFVKDDCFTRIIAWLMADLRKEGGEAVIIVHPPAV